MDYDPTINLDDPNLTGEPFDSLRQFFRAISIGEDDRLLFKQEICGYTLINGNPGQRFIVMLGRGDNGKSTLLIFMSAILGLLSIHGHNSVLMECKSGNCASPEIAELAGKRCVLYEEMDSKTALDANKVKRITGGTPINCRELFKGNFQFTPKFKCIVNLNELPQTPNGDAYAFYRRLLLDIYLGRFFDRNKGEHPINPTDIPLDPSFTPKILKNPKALAAILNWMIQGAKRLINNGFEFSVPATIREFQNSFQAEQDPNGISAFFSERVERGDGNEKLTPNILYNAYRDYCREFSLTPLECERFNRKKGHLGQTKTSHGVRYHPGWHLKQPLIVPSGTTIAAIQARLQTP